MKPVARFVVRDSGEANDGLMLGVKFKYGGKHFKQGYVYQIEEWMDELIIQEVGPSCLGRKPWYSDISSVLKNWAKHLWLTKNEADHLNKMEKEARDFELKQLKRKK